MTNSGSRKQISLHRRRSHQSEDATGAPSPVFGLQDKGWTEDQWRDLLEKLIHTGLVAWKEVTALVLGHLNPSQVGTSLASSKGFKKRYGKGNTMKIVMDWLYKQDGRCVDCGARLELQADHSKDKKQFKNPLDADFIENMVLRCRRCNVIRRPSHEFGGLTYLTAESALMWIMLVIKPRTFRDFVRLCRLYGMTMSDIRMAEAWAMTHWLSRTAPPAYRIENDLSGKYDVVLWPDSAITRVDPSFPLPPETNRIYTNIRGDSVLGFIVLQADGRMKFYEQPVGFIPFSAYDLGTRTPQSLAIQYRPPDRKHRKPQQITGLPPRGLRLLAHAIRRPHEIFRLVSEDAQDAHPQDMPLTRTTGRVVRTVIPPAKCRLIAVS